MLAAMNDTFSLLTFDCYGTLIDWDYGIRAVFAGLSGLPAASCDRLVEAYIETEAAIESEAYQRYRDVQARALEAVSRLHGFRLPEHAVDALSDALPDWPPFPDTNAALKRLKTRYKLGVLSNVDRDLFAGTRRKLEVEFDLVITAEDVRSYKPAHAHFLRMFEDAPGGRDRVLHVAQSLYHDAAPAAELGLRYAWINRHGQTRPANVPMLGEFPTLTALADALEV
jgi:2-haloacid dehalogenase